MEKNTYNWRANRATRLVWMRYDPQTLEDVEYAKEDIEFKYEWLEWFLKDLIDLSEIDREEIKDNVRSELELQENE